MQADVAVERMREVGAKGRLGYLVCEQLGLGGERKAFKVVPAPDFGQPGAPEGVRLEHFGEPCTQLSNLPVAELLGISPWVRRGARRSQEPHVNSEMLRGRTKLARVRLGESDWMQKRGQNDE